jgi:hypothetical protein
MSARTTIGRRRFLVGTIGVGLSLLGRSFIWPLVAGSGHNGLRLAGLLRDQHSAQIIGREYLNVFPAEASREKLTSLISARVPGGRRTVEAATDGDLRKALLLGSQQDFLDRHTVQLDGWVLSVTEARLCALSLCVSRRRT